MWYGLLRWICDHSWFLNYWLLRVEAMPDWYLHQVASTCRLSTNMKPSCALYGPFVMAYVATGYLIELDTVVPHLSTNMHWNRVEVAIWAEVVSANAFRLGIVNFLPEKKKWTNLDARRHGDPIWWYNGPCFVPIHITPSSCSIIFSLPSSSPSSWRTFGWSWQWLLRVTR